MPWWYEVALENRAPDFPGDEGDRHFGAVEDQFGNGVGFGGHGIEHLLAPFLRLGETGRSYGNDLHLLAFGRRIPADFAHIDQVDDALEIRALPYRNLERNAGRAELVVHVLEGGEIVGTDAVHLVDEADARNTVLVGLAPDGLGLGLDPADRAEHGHGAVEHAQGTLHLGGEVDMAGCIDDVDLVIAPVGSDSSALDGNAPFLFLRHPVHGRVAVVDLADAVYFSGIKEYTLGSGGLAGVDMSHDSDIPHLVHDKNS